MLQMVTHAKHKGKASLAYVCIILIVCIYAILGASRDCQNLLRRRAEAGVGDAWCLAKQYILYYVVICPQIHADVRCVCIWVTVSVCFVFVHMYIFVWVRVRTCVRMCAHCVGSRCVHVYVYVCVCLCLCVQACLCVFACVYVHVCLLACLSGCMLVLLVLCLLTCVLA